MNDYESIAVKMTEEALLRQIAEEAAELGHAALKLLRAMKQDSPTPVDKHTAVMHLLEEVADVQLAVDVWNVNRYGDQSRVACSIVDDIVDDKRRRWLRRLEEKENVQKN